MTLTLSSGPEENLFKVKGEKNERGEKWKTLSFDLKNSVYNNFFSKTFSLDTLKSLL